MGAVEKLINGKVRVVRGAVVKMEIGRLEIPVEHFYQIELSNASYLKNTAKPMNPEA